MTKLIAALLLALATPSIALADDAKPITTQTAHDARFVPSMRDGKPEGIKVYAIREGGKFDRPGARFQNGDTIVKVDDQSVNEDAGKALFQTKLVGAKGDGVVSLIRRGKAMELAIKGE